MNTCTSTRTRTRTVACVLPWCQVMLCLCVHCTLLITNIMLSLFTSLISSYTGRYMSPEIALAMPYGFKVDVYSLSLVMHEILTLIKPYSSPSVLREPKGFIQMVIKDGHRPALDDSLPNTIRTLLQRMWSSDAAKRPSSKEVVEYLEGLLRGDESELYPVGHFGWKNRFHEVRDSVTNTKSRERRKHKTTNLPTGTTRTLFSGKKFNEL